MKWSTTSCYSVLLNVVTVSSGTSGGPTQWFAVSGPAHEAQPQPATATAATLYTDQFDDGPAAGGEMMRLLLRQRAAAEQATLDTINRHRQTLFISRLTHWRIQNFILFPEKVWS